MSNASIWCIFFTSGGELMDWIAIDLHMHTVTGITRDGKSDDVEFTYTQFVKAILDFDLKLVATTNHNIFDISNFITLNYLCKRLNTKILPGIEIDSVLDDGVKPLHMVIIFKDNLEKNLQFGKYINEKTNIKKPQVIYNHKEIVDIIKDYDSVVIPHGDKAKGLFKDATEANIKEALKKVREGFIRIFDSPSNWKLEKIKTFLSEINEDNLDDFGGVLFSDVRKWSKYNEYYRAFRMNASPSFKGLIHSTSNPTKRFALDTSINYNHNYISKIVFKSINKNSRIQDKTIHLNRGFNCVIGKSGSGKTLLIELIKNELITKNEILNKYPFTKHSTIELYNEENVKLDPKKINVTIGANLYKKILSAYTENDTKDIYGIIKLLKKDFVARKKFNFEKQKFINKIKSYCETVKDYNATKTDVESLISSYATNINELNSLKKIKTFSVPLFENLNYTYVEDDITEITNINDDIENLKNKVKRYKGKYALFIGNQIITLEKYLIFAKKEMEQKKLEEEFENRKIQLLNTIVKEINGKISSQSARKSELRKNIIDERNKLVSSLVDNYKRDAIIKNSDLSLKTDDFNSTTLINKKYNIKVIERIDSELIKKFDIRDNLLVNTHGKKQQITSKNYNLTKKDDARKVINEYIRHELISDQNFQIKSDFDVDVKIEFNGQDISNLNPGDIAKTYISVYFEEEVNKSTNHVVLFDQIENDVDKEFISSTIKELIENTKGNIQTIIVTHDPIIAVNADPNNYIEAVKNKEKIEYRNFYAESDEMDELSNIARNVDGSKDVIRRRYEIYEGERK